MTSDHHEVWNWILDCPILGLHFFFQVHEPFHLISLCNQMKTLTLWCPNSFKMVPSFLVLLCGFWATTAGCGSRQSMDKRWYQRRRLFRRWADFTLGSKRWTSHPLLAKLTSNCVSSLPSLERKRMEISKNKAIRSKSVGLIRWFSGQFSYSYQAFSCFNTWLTAHSQ